MIPVRDDVPTRNRPVLTVALIAANVAAFAFEVSQAGGREESAALRRSIETWGLVPRDFVRGALGGGSVAAQVWLTPVTSMFLHGGALHLGGNMLYLWIFGNNVEDLLGRARFAAFYLICGLAAAAAHLAVQPDATVPVIGASGAVSGVLGAYAVSYPRARVRTLVPIGFFLTTVYVPALFFLVIWFGLQVLSGALQAPAGGAGVAWWAHVGGFLAGVALARPMRVHPPVRTRIAI
jgi:membrane associated rhomboid family serine protease